MTIMLYQPLSGRSPLSHRMQPLANQFVRSHRSFPLAQAASTLPAIELEDSDNILVLRAKLPGIEAKDLDIEVTRNAVAIAGEYRNQDQSEDKRYFQSEFRYGKFRRIVPLPAQIENDRVDADLKDGILTLRLPKTESERHRVVKVNLTEAQSEAA